MKIGNLILLSFIPKESITVDSRKIHIIAYCILSNKISESIVRGEFGLYHIFYLK